MSDRYYNPKFRVNIFNKKDNMGTIEQGNLTFLKDSNGSVAYVDIDYNLRYPILPVWDEIDPE